MHPLRLRVVVAGAILALAISMAGAQSAPPAPSAPTTPGTRGAQSPPPPMPARPPQEKVMDGPVKQVDALRGTAERSLQLGCPR